VKARKPGCRGRGHLLRQRILHADERQRVPAQDIAGIEERLLGRESPGVLQVENDRRVQEEPRAAPDLLLQFLFKGGVPQHPRANHHDGEKRALNEVHRHRQPTPSRQKIRSRPLDPNPPCRNSFPERFATAARPALIARAAAAQPRIASITLWMKPSRAAGSIQRNTATMSWSGSIQVKLPPAPLAK